MTGVVLDAFTALAAILPDARSAAAEATLLEAATRGVTVPPLWWLETGNTLLLAERAGRLRPAERRIAMVRFRSLHFETDAAAPEACWDHAFSLAQGHQLSLYDAAYLELALRRQMPLATLGRRLRAAAAAEGVPLLPESLGE
jgi:predicted nucleic acid-binding protein